MTKATLRGKPDAGKLHIRFDEGDVVSENPRRGSLLRNMNGKQTAKHLVALIVACGALALSADNYVVDEATVISSVDSTTHSNLILHADLTVCGNASGTAVKTFFTHNGVANEMGPNPGEFATLTITNGAKAASTSASAGANFVFGGNGGKGGQIYLSSPFSSYNTVLFGNRYWNYTLSSKAVSDTGCMDMFRLGPNGGLGISSLRNENPNVICRVLFEGGYLFWPNVWENKGLAAVKDARIQLVSVDGHDICLGSNTSGGMGTMNQGDGIVETIGTGDLVFWGTCNSGEANYRQRGKLGIPNTVVWGHAGDIVLRDQCWMYMAGPNALPYGAGKGGVRFELINTYDAYKNTWLDLNGKTTSVNRITSAVPKYALVTNLSSTVATLILGEQDVDGEFSATACAKTRMLKRGAGRLILHDAVLNAPFTASAGTVVVTGSVTAKSMCFDGADLIISNGTLSCTSLALTNSHVTVVTATGELQCPSITRGGNVDCTYVAAALKQGLQDLSAKTPLECDHYEADPGAGALASLAPNAALNNGSLRVKSGTVRIGGEFVTDKFWRFSVTKAQYDSQPNSADKTVVMTLAMGRWHYFTAKGGFQSVLTYKGLNVAESDLGEGCVTTSHGWILDDDSTGKKISGGAVWASPAALTRAFAEWYFSTVWTNHVATSEEPITVTQHFAADATPVFGYLFTPSANCNSHTMTPKSWIVESRSESGEWQVRDVRTDVPRTTSSSQVWENGGVPYLFQSMSANWSYRPSGQLAVAAGAKLDLDAIPAENIAISSLEIDLATGAGTITKFVPAESGTLDLTNVAATIVRKTELPIALTSVSHEDRLLNWKVRVDGVEDAFLQVFVKDGKMYVRRIRGLILLLK